MYKKIYLSGSISDLTYEQAWALFEQAEQEALKIAHEVANPMKLPFFFKPVNQEKPTWGEYMVNDLDTLMNKGCDSIYMLTNWQTSRGARIEHATAKEMSLKEPMTILYQYEEDLCTQTSN